MEWGPIVDSVRKSTGSIEVYRVAPGLLRSIVKGHIDKDILRVMIRTRDDEALRSGNGFHYFHGCAAVTSYEPEVRQKATAYMMSLTPPYTEIHVLTTNKLVSMGVSAAMLALRLAGRPFYSHVTPSSFELAFQRKRTVSAA